MERRHRQHYQRDQQALHERRQIPRPQQYGNESQQQSPYSQRTLNERHSPMRPTPYRSTNRPQEPRPPKRMKPLSKPKRAPLVGKWRAVVVGIVLGVATLMTVSALSPSNKVKRLIVTGYHYADPELIKATTGIRPLDDVRNVFSQKQLIEKAIKESSPIVDSITFKHSEWEHLELHVNEHQVVAKIDEDGQQRPVLDNGQSDVIAMEATQLTDVPLLVNFTRQGALPDIANTLRKIDPALLALMESISPVQDVNKPNSIDIKMKDGNTIRAIISTLDKRMGYYPAIVQQLNGQQGVINLEVGAYFTPYGLNTNSVKLNTN